MSGKPAKMAHEMRQAISDAVFSARPDGVGFALGVLFKDEQGAAVWEYLVALPQNFDETLRSLLIAQLVEGLLNRPPVAGNPNVTLGRKPPVT